MLSAVKCPNCSAPLDSPDVPRCPYCGSSLTRTAKGAGAQPSGSSGPAQGVSHQSFRPASGTQQQGYRPNPGPQGFQPPPPQGFQQGYRPNQGQPNYQQNFQQRQQPPPGYVPPNYAPPPRHIPPRPRISVLLAIILLCFYMVPGIIYLVVMSGKQAEWDRMYGGRR